MKKIIKKIFLPTMISATLLSSLTGCGKENKNQEVKNANEIDKYIKDNEPVLQQENTEFDGYNISSNSEENTTDELGQISVKSYEEYNKFYTSIGVNQYDVIRMVNIINGNVKGYSEDEIYNSLALIQYILLSDNNIQLLDNCNAIKMQLEPLDDEMEIIYSPKISDLILDKENIENIIAYENLRDKLIDEIISTGTYSNEIACEITKATVEQEVNEYNSYKGNMDLSIINEGLEYVQTATKLSLCNLTQMVNPNSSFIKGENNDKYQLSPRTDVNEYGYIEADLFAVIYQLERDGKEIPSDMIKNRADIESRLISTKYMNGLCTLEDQLLTKAGYKKTSMLDLQKQKKELLELKKLENIFAQNEMFEGYNLTFKM